jgi:predicted acetyltransferase
LPKKQRTEKLEFKICRTTKSTWEFYKKYHYLNESIGAGHYYEMKLNDKKVGFMSIARFPHPQAKDIMTVGRLVIVPEFQGFGVGIKFTNEISELYKGNRIRITTSLKPFIESLNKSNKWKCVRFGRVGNPGKSSSIHNKNKDCSVSRNRITATFQKV